MKTKRLLGAFSLLFVLAGVSSAQSSASPSFDCSKADGQVEELICRDEALAGLDRKMATVYGEALKAWQSDVVATQKALQRGWIKGRDECWKADDLKTCVELAYKTRTVEVQISSGQLMVPTPVGYRCEGHEDTPFFATYYRETDPPSAVITFGDDQVTAFLAPTASGTKYAAANVELWEHQGEATVQWFGTELTCEAP